MVSAWRVAARASELGPGRGATLLAQNEAIYHQRALQWEQQQKQQQATAQWQQIQNQAVLQQRALQWEQQQQHQQAMRQWGLMQQEWKRLHPGQ